MYHHMGVQWIYITDLIGSLGLLFHTCALMSALFFIRYLTISTWPLSQAQWSKVIPWHKTKRQAIFSETNLMLNFCKTACDQHWVKKDCNQARGVKLINILNTTVYCEDHFSKHWSNKMKTTWVQFFNWPIPVCIKFFNCSWLLHFWLLSTKEDDLLNYWERQTLKLVLFVMSL